jgi:hypothetical protein
VVRDEQRVRVLGGKHGVGHGAVEEQRGGVHVRPQRLDWLDVAGPHCGGRSKGQI